MKTGISFLDRTITSMKQDQVLSIVLIAVIATGAAYAIHITTQETIAYIDLQTEQHAATAVLR